MDQQKIGKFLKYLRKDKGLTQEQLAEHFCVSSEPFHDGKTETICRMWIFSLGLQISMR